MAAPPDPAAARRLTPAGALARAQAALEDLSGELQGWLREDAARLYAAHERWRAVPDAEAALRLRCCAHDLKGLGATYGYPLAGRIGGSLERLMATDAPGPALVNAHVDAIAAVLTADARAPDHPLGLRLAVALEAATTLHAGAG